MPYLKYHKIFFKIEYENAIRKNYGGTKMLNKLSQNLIATCVITLQLHHKWASNVAPC